MSLRCSTEFLENKSQMAPNEKEFFDEKLNFTCTKCSRNSNYDKLMKVRGSIYDHFPLSTFSRGAMRNSFFRKEFRTFRFLFSKNDRNSMKMGLNRSAMSPHGLIFDEDGAVSCPMPLDALPTPRGVVLSYSNIAGSLKSNQRGPQIDKSVLKWTEVGMKVDGSRHGSGRQLG